MQATLRPLLDRLTLEARRLRLADRDWAARAQLRPETLARLKGRADCDLATLTALAAAVELRVGLSPWLSRELPARFGREEEEALLSLCSAQTLDLRRWLAAGPRFFLAGVAVLVAGMREVQRAEWLVLGEALYPGMTSAEVFEAWLAASPVRPSRFVPMLRQRLQDRLRATAGAAAA